MGALFYNKAVAFSEDLGIEIEHDDGRTMGEFLAEANTKYNYTVSFDSIEFCSNVLLNVLLNVQIVMMSNLCSNFVFRQTIVGWLLAFMRSHSCSHYNNSIHQENKI